ncbi:MAG: hypothetical protein HZR80_00365 [Candidatus Heimdallarchaeota archaeon]
MEIKKINPSRKILYQAKKPKRGTFYQIYTNGTLEFMGGITTKNQIHISNDIRKWKRLPSEKNKDSLIVKVTYYFINCLEEEEQISCQSEIIHNGYGIYLQPLNTDLNYTKILAKLKERKITSCSIPGMINGKEQLESTEYFIKSSNLREKCEIPAIENLIPLVNGGYQESEFSIYKSKTEQIYIKQIGRIDHWGQFRLSADLFRYFQDWEEIPNFVCSKEQAEEYFIPSSVHKRKTGKRTKNLNFPIYEEPQRIEVLFTNPSLTLTNEAKKTINFKKQLIKNNFPIISLKINARTKETHIDKNFERKCIEIFQKLNKKIPKATLATEVDLFIDSNYNTTGNKKCFDIVFYVPLFNSEMTLILSEIRTSQKHSKYLNTSGIAELFHVKNIIQSHYFIPNIFLNRELFNPHNIDVTRLFSHTIGIPIINKKSIMQYYIEPLRLLTYLSNFKGKEKQTTSSNKMIHPFTHSLVDNNDYYAQAFDILQLKDQKQTCNSFKHYLLFMGIREKEFSLIGREYITKQEITSIIRYLKQQRKTRLSTEEKGALLLIHNLLIKQNSFAYLSSLEKKERNNDIDLLLKNKKLIEKSLPINVKLLGFHKSNSKGGNFEREIRRNYEDFGYEVISNLLISCGGQLFEIDNLVISKTGLRIISCKDHSQYTPYDILVNHIRNYANILELNNFLLGNQKAILYIKVRKEYANQLKEKYEIEDWTKNVQIKILKAKLSV